MALSELTGTVNKELEALLRTLAARSERRLFLAIAGPPGSGKSTLAQATLRFVRQSIGISCAVLEMDGFHIDNGVLAARGLLDRKGAPETFDVFGLRNAIDRLKVAAPEGVLVPTFDRTLDLARAGARHIAADVRLIIVEGNYLAVDTYPWSILRDVFEATVFLDVPREELRARLKARWVGFGFPPAEVERKVMGNDMINAEFVFEHSRRSGLILRNA